jgi:hypothetical protein
MQHLSLTIQTHIHNADSEGSSAEPGLLPNWYTPDSFGGSPSVCDPKSAGTLGRGAGHLGVPYGAKLDQGRRYGGPPGRATSGMLQVTALSTTQFSCFHTRPYCTTPHFRKADRHFAAYTGSSAPVRDRRTGSPFPTGRTSKWLLPLIRHWTLPAVVNEISCSRISRGYRLITRSGIPLFVHSVRLLINFREPCRKEEIPAFAFRCVQGRWAVVWYNRTGRNATGPGGATRWYTVRYRAEPRATLTSAAVNNTNSDVGNFLESSHLADHPD